jgi:ribosomal protein L19E
MMAPLGEHRKMRPRGRLRCRGTARRDGLGNGHGRRKGDAATAIATPLRPR